MTVIIQPKNGGQFLGKRRLPPEFQRVEYIESDGNQWIDTGVVPDGHTGVMLRASFNDTLSDVFRFGIRKNNGDSRFIIGTTNRAFYIGWDRSYGVDAQGHWKIVPNTPSTIYMNYKDSRIAKTDIDDFTISLPNLTTAFDDTMIMFGRRSLGVVSSNQQKVYECNTTHYFNSTRIFVPCYRKSDGVIGMYDMAGSVCPLTDSPFYINSGTGSFTKGNDVY